MRDGTTVDDDSALMTGGEKKAKCDGSTPFLES
jgi:hypothetical protein